MSIFRSDTSGQALAYRDFVQREERFVRAPYNPELEFYQAVVSGNLKKIKEMTKESFLAKKEGWGTLSANPVQNVKYHFAITAAVIARYCINAGMDLHVAYNLSDYSSLLRTDAIPRRKLLPSIPLCVWTTPDA